MPLELQIIRANEFVRLGPKEHLNMAETRKALELLVKACRKRGIDRALMDLREVPVPEKPAFTPKELASLVATFREAGFTPEDRLAVLYRSDPHYGARLFAFISAVQGCHVAAFEEFEKAVVWLSEGEQGQERVQGTPIQISAPETRKK